MDMARVGYALRRNVINVTFLQPLKKKGVPVGRRRVHMLKSLMGLKKVVVGVGEKTSTRDLLAYLTELQFRDEMKKAIHGVDHYIDNRRDVEIVMVTDGVEFGGRGRGDIYIRCDRDLWRDS